jgi:phage terminase large subunit-like protein
VSKRDYIRVARDHAQDVADGRILACRYVRLVCLRFLEEFASQGAKDFPYRLDAKAATKVCRFVELLPHVKGKWAREHERLSLEPWQVFINVNVFGWKRKTTGLRRYRRVYVEVPRKNGKSSFTAGIANYMLVDDGEHGAEVYSGATSEKQAWEVFGPARMMAKKTPEMLEHYGVDVGAKNLNVPSMSSKFEPIIGKPGDGASPSFSITDEYHEHATSEQYDTMVTGMGSREQPIAWVITTAGSDTSGPCYALRSQAIDSIEGKVEHDELFAIVYTVDEAIGHPGEPGYQPGDDWTSETALRKANPNMGISVFEDFLRTEQARAVKSPREQATFKTKHLNIWVTAASPYFNSELWKRAGDARLSPDQFAGEPCVVAFDVAAKIDLAAKVKLFTRMIDGKRHYYPFGCFYIPAEVANAPANRHYAGWVERGYVTATPGNTTDYDYIEADIKDDAERHSVVQIGGDPWNATQMITHLQAFIGADKVVEVPQTVMHLSEPMKEVQAAIADGRMHHDGNAAFAWQIGNVTAQVDRNDNVFPRKEKPERKIDGAIALIIAVGCSLRMPVDTGSTYDSGGVLFL